MKLKLVAILLAGSAIALSSPALAAQEPTPTEAPDPADPDASDTTADAAIAAAQPVNDADAKIELLQAQVEALQASIEELKSQTAKATPSWKGAPVFEDKDAGFSFKPRGALQFDAGYVGYPRGEELRGTVGGLNFANLGWNSRARRILLGADGTLPGGFRYSAEFNFAQGVVDYEDIFLAYDFKKAPLTVQIGNIYPFSSLETMTSSKFTSFMERASITDAFNYNRRLGIGFTANDKAADRWIVQAGIFNEPINNGLFTRTGWQASLRGVFSPNVGSGRLHLGANFQHRQNTREAKVQTYQSRPLTQLTNERFVSTGALASKGDDVAGLEFGAVFKRFHAAAEAQKVWVRHAYDAAEITAINLRPDSNVTFPTGTVPLNGNPSFWGGYAELGFYLTGETRGYKGGKWDRTKVLKPFDQGGWGAFQVNGRVDYVELRDRVDDSSSSVSAPFYVNGGKQVGYEASLIWNPMDYIRFMAQYGHIDVTGGPRGSVATLGPPPLPGIFPVGTTTPANQRKYGVDLFAVRAQVDF